MVCRGAIFNNHLTKGKTNMSKTKKENGPKAMKMCAVCGEMFTPKTANAAYCSTACYKNAKAARKKAANAMAKKEKAEAPKAQKAVSAPVAKAAPKKTVKRVKKHAPKALPPAQPKIEARKERHASILEEHANLTTEVIVQEIAKAGRHLLFALKALYPDAVEIVLRESKFEVGYSKKTDAK